MRPRCGGGAAACVTGVLVAPGTQGRWQLEQQEIQCSRGVWQPVLANTLQYSCLENPLTEKPGRPQPTGLQRVVPDQSNLACIEASLFCLWQLCPSEGWCEGGTADWFAGTLAVPSVQGHRLPPCRVMALSESFSEPLVAGNQKNSLASLSL